MYNRMPVYIQTHMRNGLAIMSFLPMREVMNSLPDICGLWIHLCKSPKPVSMKIGWRRGILIINGITAVQEVLQRHIHGGLITQWQSLLELWLQAWRQYRCIYNIQWESITLCDAYPLPQFKGYQYNSQWSGYRLYLNRICGFYYTSKQ